MCLNPLPPNILGNFSEFVLAVCLLSTELLARACLSITHSLSFLARFSVNIYLQSFFSFPYTFFEHLQFFFPYISPIFPYISPVFPYISPSLSLHISIIPYISAVFPYTSDFSILYSYVLVFLAIQQTLSCVH